MPRPTHRRDLPLRERARLTACLSGIVVGGLTAGLLGTTAASAFADRTGRERGGPSAPSELALDVGLRPTAAHATLPLERARVKVKARPRSRGGRAGGTSAHGTTSHGTDTGGGDGSTDERDLALAATWQVDPALLQPQPGDSSATLEARATLAAVTDRLHVVMARYTHAQAVAQDAAAGAIRARAALKQARADAVAAHHVYVRDHRILVQMVTTSYEQGPVTSMQFLLTAHTADDVMVGIGTMQQLQNNEASVVSDAAAATTTMQETAAHAQRASEAARNADQRADHALAEASAAGHQVLGQLNKARQVLTLSVLADQMRTTLADAMRYAEQLKPGSVAFPLPPNSGYYDNHNWGEHSAHWASIHTGDDYSVACGTPVRAATAGTIEILTDQRWAGPWLVMVSTGPGKLTTWYAHMEALGVKAGQHVKPGQVIGAVGDKGNATGCHLHFELHPDGGSIYQDTTDPDPWLKAVGAH